MAALAFRRRGSDHGEKGRAARLHLSSMSRCKFPLCISARQAALDCRSCWTRVIIHRTALPACNRVTCERSDRDTAEGRLDEKVPGYLISTAPLLCSLPDFVPHRPHLDNQPSAYFRQRCSMFYDYYILNVHISTENDANSPVFRVQHVMVINSILPKGCKEGRYMHQDIAKVPKAHYSHMKLLIAMMVLPVSPKTRRY